jgi:hypothetical protein
VSATKTTVLNVKGIKKPLLQVASAMMDFTIMAQ